MLITTPFIATRSKLKPNYDLMILVSPNDQVYLAQSFDPKHDLHMAYFNPEIDLCDYRN